MQLQGNRTRENASNDDRPLYFVGTMGLDLREVKLIEIVFRHSTHNVFAYRLAPEAEAASLMLIDPSREEGATFLERLKARGSRQPYVTVVNPALIHEFPGSVPLDRLTLQMLPILNRLVREIPAEGEAHSAAMTDAPTPPLAMLPEAANAPEVQFAESGPEVDLARRVEPTLLDMPKVEAPIKPAEDLHTPVDAPVDVAVSFARQDLPAADYRTVWGRPLPIATCRLEPNEEPASAPVDEITAPVALPVDEEPPHAETPAAPITDNVVPIRADLNRVGGVEAKSDALPAETPPVEAPVVPTPIIEMPKFEATAEAPALPPVMAPVMAPVTPQPPAAPVAEPPPRLKVLIVDDSPTVQRQLFRTLTSIGLLCDLASDAAQAQNHLQTNHYDLMFADLMLPDMDGVQLLRWIRREKRTRMLPVVMLTGRSSTFDHARAVLAGSTLYLEKPISLKTLEAALIKILRKSLAIDDLKSYLRPFVNSAAGTVGSGDRQ